LPKKSPILRSGFKRVRETEFLEGPEETTGLNSCSVKQGFAGRLQTRWRLRCQGVAVQPATPQRKALVVFD
jgi:hypothetical protein